MIEDRLSDSGSMDPVSQSVSHTKKSWLVSPAVYSSPKGAKSGAKFLMSTSWLLNANLTGNLKGWFPT